MSLISKKYEELNEKYNTNKTNKQYSIMIIPFIVPLLLALCLYFINIPFITAGYTIVIIIDVIIMIFSHVMIGLGLIGMILIYYDVDILYSYQKNIPNKFDSFKSILILILSRGSIVMMASYFIRPHLLIWAAITFTTLTIFNIIVYIFNLKINKEFKNEN